jgi:hypothetical protein
LSRISFDDIKRLRSEGSEPRILIAILEELVSIEDRLLSIEATVQKIEKNQ